MVVVNRRFMENGKRIVELKPDSILIKDIFKNTVELAERFKCDEYRMKLNGVNLTFESNITVSDLYWMYNQTFEPEPKKTEKLTSEDYQRIEFENVGVVNTSDWDEEEKYSLYLVQLDLALLTKDIEWAKTVHENGKKLKIGQ